MLPLGLDGASFVVDQRVHDVASIERLQCLADRPGHPYRARFSQVMRWIVDYLEAPHPALGRKGAVCPYMRRSRLEKATHVTAVGGAHIDPDGLKALLLALSDRFSSLPCGSSPINRAVILLLPDVPQAEADALFDPLLAELRPVFVARNQMIGEFHAGPPARPGLHNPDFRPLYAPFPMMAIRTLVRQDIAFLRGDRELERLHARAFA
jgi:hypothetical protein